MQYIADIFIFFALLLWNCACLMLAVWRDALWQDEASLGATCPSLTIPLTPPRPLYPNTTREEKILTSAYQWRRTHPLTRGSHWLTDDALPSFWATKGWGVSGGWGGFHLFCFVFLKSVIHLNDGASCIGEVSLDGADASRRVCKTHGETGGIWSMWDARACRADEREVLHYRMTKTKRLSASAEQCQ